MEEVDLERFNLSGLLLGNMVYNVIDNDFPLLVCNQIFAFEAHLLCELGLLSSKFMEDFCRLCGFELSHLKSNAISILGVFTMLYECSLGTAPFLPCRTY
jgi:hypothetical protein